MLVSGNIHVLPYFLLIKLPPITVEDRRPGGLQGQSKCTNFRIMSSSEMLGSVVLVRTGFSEERIASIIFCILLRLLVTTNVVPGSPILAPC
jgi:hypothetical protein